MRVDFYLLKTPHAQARLQMACRILEKAYQQGHTIYVHATHEREAQQLDEALWTFKDTSFIPHHLGETEGPAPIIIGYPPQTTQQSEILLNLADPLPEFYPQFQRIIEIVAHEDQSKALARTHYRTYHQHGADIHTHNL